jgi:hypothetical protein
MILTWIIIAAATIFAILFALVAVAITYGGSERRDNKNIL